MTALPTRQQIDRAEPLEFGPRPVASTANPTITIHGTYQGWPIEATFTGKLDQLPGAIERLQALGVTPAALVTTPAAPAKPKKQQLPDVERYAPDGAPICPIHNVPMRDSQFGGHYCGEKGGSLANAKGYCGMKAD